MCEEAPSVSAPLIDLEKEELLIAVTSGNIERARQLLSKNKGGDPEVDPNSIDRFGVSCLSLAVRSRNREMVRLLIEAGANPNAPVVDKSDSPMHRCMKMDDREIAQILVDGGFNIQNLNIQLAAADGCSNVIKFFLERGIDINARNAESGCTLLHVAVLSNNPDLVDLLIRWDADVNIPNLLKQTPLDSAIDRNSVQCVDLLLANGARMRAVNRAKDSCLKAALRRGNLDTTDCVIRHLAILESQGPFVDPDDYELIEQLPHPAARDYFNVCRNELQRAKSTLILPLISVYDVLTEGDRNRFVRDVKAIDAVRAYDPGNKFPMYDWLIRYGIYRFLINTKDTVKPAAD